MASEEQPWKTIASRKQRERLSKIPRQYLIPAEQLPRDPPTPQAGPQPVINLPRKFLSSFEITITESHSVPSLLSAITSRRWTSVEVTRAFCHRAAIAQQLTNCLTEILFDTALRRAEELDNYLHTHGVPIGPLHGLPVSVKDTFDITGVDSSIGIASLCFRPAKQNAPLVQLLLSLGCVIVAKTNVPQTLASLDSVNNVFGRTMNPINRLLTAGGSSGGEGVLVAMKGCMMGFGTDIGGSIRIPAMCNGVYGFKPSSGRLPYGGQQMTGVDGMSRTSIQAVAGPLGRSVDDIAVVMREVVPRGRLFGEDCFASHWDGIVDIGVSAGVNLRGIQGSGADGEFVIGVLRSDGNCNLLPPIRNVIDEVVETLKRTRGVQVIELRTPKAWTRSQSVMNKLMGVDGGQHMADLLDATKEPLVPWTSTRFKRGQPRTLSQVAELQAQRAGLEHEMMKVWIQEDKHGRRSRRIDAIVCPLAPHPVPEIERYNSVGYTSSWVLLDMPAGSIPVRSVNEADLELGRLSLTKEPISSWDVKCRELWMEDTTDRKVYLGSPLSVQVVVPRAEDERLIEAMKVVDSAIRNDRSTRARL